MGVHPYKGDGWDEFLRDFFGLCVSCDKVGILLSSGLVVFADRFFLFSFNMDDRAHRYFSLPDGIVGQGSLSEQFVDDEIEAEYANKSMFYRLIHIPYKLGQKSGSKDSVREETERDLLGYVGARVIFREVDVQTYLKAMAGDKPEPVSEKRCAMLLVAAFDRGEPLIKVSAKEDFAPNLGQRAFLRAWQMATSQRPDMSKPGRPKQGE